MRRVKSIQAVEAVQIGGKVKGGWNSEIDHISMDIDIPEYGEAVHIVDPKQGEFLVPYGLIKYICLSPQEAALEVPRGTIDANGNHVTGTDPSYYGEGVVAPIKRRGRQPKVS